jgi:hypothetical protein
MKSRDLFDVIEETATPADPKVCPHPKWEQTTTVWPGETFDRLTWTCAECRHVRGRA